MNNNLSSAWEYYTHADNLSSGRVNFFLVAESMLVAAFVTLPNNESYIRILVSTLALIYTSGWFYVNARLAKRMAILIPKLKEDPMYKDYLEAGKGLSAKIVLCYILPLVTFSFWLLLLLQIT